MYVDINSLVKVDTLKFPDGGKIVFHAKHEKYNMVNSGSTICKICP
jgi:hypothetical protein